MAGRRAPRAAPQGSELSHYLRWACVMAAAALVVGALLVPRGDELLLIFVKNHDLARAKAVLAGGEGALSASSAVARGELFLFEGRVDEAVDETETYAAAHPGNVSAWEHLAELYRNAQRSRDRTRALAHIYQLAPTEARARELAAQYRRIGDAAAEAGMLRDLVDDGRAQAPDLMRSARLDAALGHGDRARATLERLRRVDSSGFDPPAMEFYASLLVDAGRLDMLPRVFQPLPLVRKEPRRLVDLAQALKTWGELDAAVAVLEPLPGLEPQPEWLAALAGTAVGTDRAPHVVAQLTAIDAASPLPQPALEALVTLALSISDDATIDRLLGGYPEGLEPAVEARIIGQAASRGDRARAQALIARLGDDSLTDSPVLALELAADRGDTAAVDKWIGTIERTGSASPEDIGAIAKIESQMGRKAAAFDRLVGLAKNGRAPDWALNDLSSAAVELGRTDELLALLGPLAARSSDVGAAWARLAAKSGRTDLIARWFAGPAPRRVDAAALRDVYYTLSDRNAGDLAAEAARRLFGATGRAEDARLLGQALLTAGRPMDAVTFLRKALDGSSQTVALYCSALYAAEAEGDPVADQIRQVFSARLRDARLPVAERPMLVDGLWMAGERAGLDDDILRLAQDDLTRWLGPLVETARARPDAARRPAVDLIAAALDRLGKRLPGAMARAPGGDPREPLMQALLDLDAPDSIVLVPLGRMASDLGGTWMYADDERLAKSGRTADRIALWKRVGQAPAAPADVKRAAASRLSDLGDAAAAAAMIQPLAAGAGPDAPDVEALLFYWGAHPTSKQLAWLVSRFKTAPPADQPAWIGRISAAGGARAVVTAAPTLPLSASPAFVRAWLDAYRATLDPSLERRAVEAFLARDTVDVDGLRQAARLALGDGLSDLAMRAFRRVEAARPGDSRIDQMARRPLLLRRASR